jgi:PAS domain-containing protein
MPSFKDVLSLLLPAFRRIWSAIEILAKHHRARMIAAGLLVAGAVLTGNLYVDRTKQYQDIVASTVRAEGEDTPQRFKVLEAFIMSTIDGNLSTRVGEVALAPPFVEGLTKLHQILSRPASSLESLGLRLSIPNYTSANSVPSHGAIVTDDAAIGYLFFPLSLVRANLVGLYPKILGQSANDRPSADLSVAIAQNDPVIVDDIRTSRALLEVMQSFTATPFAAVRPEHFGATVRPVQIYYITKNGLNRIVNNTSADSQRIVYRNMFRSTTFFPSRPYFIEAFKKQPGTLEGISVTKTVKEVFYISKPYLDIGGFGVVVTLARSLTYSGHSDAAICFDLKVSSIEGLLKPRLASFGAAAPKVTCSIGFQSRVECSPSSGEGTVPFSKTLEELLNDSMRKGDLSTVVGNISILDDHIGSPTAMQASVFDLLRYPVELLFGHNTRPITFAIPVSEPRALSSAAIEADFLISSLNLERFLQVTTLLGFVSVLLLGTAFCVVLLSWQTETQTRRSFEDAFERVDQVLYGAPTAYVRLNANDQIVDCNTAFCALLKMSADSRSVESIKSHTFESQVAPRSIATYRDVQERRRSGKDVAPYTLYFKCDDGSEVEARVSSGAIPGQSSKELPGTFGIVIPAPIVEIGVAGIVPMFDRAESFGKSRSLSTE